MDAFVNNLQLQGSAEVPSIESSPPVESQVTYTETLRVQDQFNEAVIHNSGVISSAISVTNEIIEDNAHPRNLTYYVPLSVTVEITPGVIMTQSVVARLETSTGVISDTLEVVKGLEQEAEDLKTSSQYTKTITHAQNQINILSARRNQIGISRNEKERINVQISVWQSAAKEAQKKLDYELYILNLAQDIAWEEAFAPYITDSNGQEIYLNGGSNNDSSEGASEVATIDSETASSIYTDEMTEDELIEAYLRHKGLTGEGSSNSSESTVLGSTSALAMLFSAQGKEALLRSILVGSLLLSACGRGDTEVSIDTPPSAKPVAQEPDKGVAPAPTVVSVEIGGGVVGPDVTSTVPPQEFGTGGQAGAPVVTPDLQGPVVVEGEPILPLEYARFPDLEITGSEGSGFRITQNTLGREVTIAVWDTESSNWVQPGLTQTELKEIESSNVILFNDGKGDGVKKPLEIGPFYADTAGGMALYGIAASDYKFIQSDILNKSDGTPTGWKFASLSLDFYQKDSDGNYVLQNWLIQSGGVFISPEGKKFTAIVQQGGSPIGIGELPEHLSPDRDIGDGGSFTQLGNSPTLNTPINAGEPVILWWQNYASDNGYAEKVASATVSLGNYLDSGDLDGTTVRLAGLALGRGVDANFTLGDNSLARFTSEQISSAILSHTALPLPEGASSGGPGFIIRFSAKK